MRNFLLVLMMIAVSASCFAEKNVNTSEGDVTLYFARHGKTLFNSFDRVQGWADSPLTEEGIRVAKYLGEGLRHIPFDRFYTSDAGRQRETLAVILKQAGIVNYHNTELPGLREAFFGGFEGGFNAEMANAMAPMLGLKDGAAIFQKMKAAGLDVKALQDALAEADPKRMAENYQQVKTRTRAALAQMVTEAQASGAKNILAVSSGTAMQIMVAELTDNPAKNKPLANAAVVKIVYHNGQYSVQEMGEMKYVEAGKRAFSKNIQ